MSGFGRINDLSLNYGLTVVKEQTFEPLAPAARPKGLDEAKFRAIDERAGSNTDRELNEWLLEDIPLDPELQLPSAFNTAFDAARDDLREWLVNDQGTQPDQTRAIKLCQRLLTEVRSNLDLVHFYVNAIFKG